MSYSFLAELLRFLSPAEDQSSSQKAGINSVHAHWVERAVVTEDIQPGCRGRVLFQSTTWFAICPYYAVLPANTPVRVVNHYNATTLIVEPVLSVLAGNLPSIDAA
jgi:hypothetical protein